MIGCASRVLVARIWGSDFGIELSWEEGTRRMGSQIRNHGCGLLLGLLLVLPSCGPDRTGEPSGRLEQRIDSAGGVVRVRNLGAAPRWSLNPLVTVGSGAATGAPAADEFGRISTVSTDRQGNLWVADALSHDIRVFGSGGSLVRRIGREGQGPGEFLSIYSLAWVGDVALALDFGNGRIAELSETGEWLGTRPAPGRVSGPPSSMRFYATSDTAVYQWSARASDGGIELEWVEQGRDSATFAWPRLELDPPEPTQILCHSPNGTISFFDLPFSGQLLKQPAGRGLTYVVWTEEYHIAELDAQGDTVRTIEYARPSAPISDAEWDEARAEYQEFRDQWTDAKCDPSGVSRPALKPAIRNVLVDTRGDLWVEAYTAKGLVWDVFDSGGVLMGTLPGFEYLESVAPSIRGDLIAWVEADSLGVERARVARVLRQPSS